MTLRPLPLLRLGLAIGALTTTACGDMTITANTDKPDSARFGFDTSEETGNTTLFHRGNGAFRQLGQTFTLSAPNFTLRAISVKVWEAAPETWGKRFSLKLFRVANPDLAPDLSHDLLFAESGHLPEEIHPQQHLTLQLETPFPLEEGASYMLLLVFEEPTSPGNQAKSLGLERTNGNAPFRGRMWIYDGEAFASDRKALLFSLHGTNTP